MPSIVGFRSVVWLLHLIAAWKTDMPALRFFGRISALSLLFGLLALTQAQTAVPAPEPSNPNMVAAVSGNASVPAASEAPLPPLSDELTGDLQINRRQYQAAIESYSKVTEPTAVLWNKMGIAYQMLLDTKNATRCYKQSLKLDPNFPGALNNLATLEDARKNFTAAERLYRQALKVAPDSPRTLKNLGTNLLMQHKFRESSEVYARALALDPRVLDKYSGPTAEAHVSMKVRGEASYVSARTCARAGLNSCAIEYLRKAFDEGSATMKQVTNDKDFEALRGEPEFERLLAQQQ